MHSLFFYKKKKKHHSFCSPPLTLSVVQ